MNGGRRLKNCLSVRWNATAGRVVSIRVLWKPGCFVDFRGSLQGQNIQNHIKVPKSHIIPFLKCRYPLFEVRKNNSNTPYGVCTRETPKIKKLLAFRYQNVRSGFSDFHCNNVTGVCHFDRFTFKTGWYKALYRCMTTGCWATSIFETSHNGPPEVKQGA